MDYKAFLQKQQGIYARMRGEVAKVASDGVNASKAVTEQHTAYIIAFRHPSEITDAISAFGERIERAVPSFSYDGDNIHTTAFVHNLTKASEAKFNPEQKTLDDLAAIADVARNRPIRIIYPEWCYNQDAVTVAGYPTTDFADIITSIGAAAAAKGYKLTDPWGAHITAARYTEAMKDPQRIADFQKLMLEAPALGMSKPTHLSVGLFKVHSGGCDFHEDRRILLQG